ncbi:hypothetical protein BH11ARM2_BH11ARM2_28770 [soil metagenome]
MPVNYPDTVTLNVPVLKNGSFWGYAKSTDIPVNRTQDVFFLLHPKNRPFGASVGEKMGGAPTRAVAAVK